MKLIQLQLKISYPFILIYKGIEYNDGLMILIPFNDSDIANFHLKLIEILEGISFKGPIHNDLQTGIEILLKILKNNDGTYLVTKYYSGFKYLYLRELNNIIIEDK